MFSVNPTGQIASANVGIDQGQKSLVTAETKMQQVVSGGPGFAASTRHELFLANTIL
jgi:hypothetical protein